jgi:type II secretory pathway component GspD/PulD (secretin)
MDAKWEGPRRVARLTVLISLAMAVFLTPVQAQQRSSSGLVSFQTDSTSVAEILKIVADRAGLNIITTPAVQGRYISLRLRETPYEDALNLIVRASGLAYERVGESIIVADPATFETRTALVPRVFNLEFAEAEDVREALEVISNEVRANYKGTQLVMLGTQSQVEQAANIIGQMDHKPPQILLEARLIEVNRSKLLEVGIDWEKITKWTTVITEGPQSPEASAVGQLPQDIGYTDFDSDPGTKWHRQLGAWEVALDALITDGSARLLANTSVVTLDGEPAEIFAGETVPVVITSLQTPGAAGGVFQTVQLEKIDVGVRLNITPRISEDDFLTVLVQPEVSRIIKFVGPDDDLPQTSTRRAKTYVRVRSGEKIYMGGLLTEEKRLTVKKVPLLGQLPLLGYFFQHRSDETIRLDLVIEITPRIVGDTGSTLPVIDMKALSLDSLQTQLIGTKAGK